MKLRFLRAALMAALNDSFFVSAAKLPIFYIYQSNN